jgi:hypothetical protein
MSHKSFPRGCARPVLALPGLAILAGVSDNDALHDGGLDFFG